MINVAVAHKRKMTVEWLAPAALVGMIIGSAMLLNGYLFGFSDHNDHLLLVRRMTDSNYLSRDWYVNQATAEGGVRNNYSHLMALLSRILSEAESFWLVYVLTFLLMGAGIYAWAWQHWQSHATALLTLFLVVFNHFGTLGSSNFTSKYLVPSFIAWAILVWALVLVERKQWVMAALLLGGCVFIHPLLGMAGFALLFAWGLLRTLPGERCHWMAGVAVFSVLAALGASTLIFQHVGKTLATEAEIVQILAYMRNPWHYVPSTWPSEIYLQFFYFVATIVLLVAWQWPKSRDTVCLLGLIGAGCLIGAFFTEVYPIAIIAKSQPFRLTPLFQLFGALYLSAYCLTIWNQTSYTGPPTALAIIVLFSGATFLDKSNLLFWVFLIVLTSWLQIRFFSHSLLSVTQAAIAIALIGWVGVTVWQAQDFRSLVALGILAVALFGVWRLDSWSDQPLRVSGLTGLVGVIAIALLVLGHQVAMGKIILADQIRPFLGYIQGTLHYNGAFDDIALWASENTHVDALFIVPPNYQTFRVKAERAIVVDFKAFVFDDESMVEWLARLEAVVGHDNLALGYGYGQELHEAYNHQSPESLLKAADNYGADFVVVPRDLVLPLDLAYANKGYAVFRVKRRHPCIPTP